MTTSVRTLSSLAAGVLLLAAALTGCATTAGGSPAPESTAGAPSSDTSSSDPSYAPRVAWLDASAFVLKTWSDACAPLIGDLVAGEQSLEVVLVDGDDEICAAVQTAHGMYVGLPAGFDSSLPVEVTVTDANGTVTELTLPGLKGGEMQPADRMPEQIPAAAWIEDEELAVLTWGSSTCVPGSGAFEAVSEAEGIVRLYEPTDTICTRDLVPRITFVRAEGVAADAVLTLADHVDADGEPVILTIVK